MTGVSPDSASQFFWDESANRTLLCAPGLRAQFERSGATWTHTLILPFEHDLEIATTLESEPGRDEPGRVTSPVYQEIHRHHAEGAEALCLLLTGTLYKHHFSAVVRLGNDRDRPGGLMLDIDVADRCRARVECLAATYKVNLDSGKLAAASPGAITWDKVGRSACQLELVALPPSTLVLAEAGRHATLVQVVAAIEPESFTHRLHYRWRWTSNSGLTR